jgi:predicted nucleic-acid-binding Zn-ribbon protein
MLKIEDALAGAFVCAKCGSRGASVQNLAMSGTGLSRLFDVQPYRYAFASCQHCGYTEVYNLTILAGADALGDVLDVLFAG